MIEATCSACGTINRVAGGNVPAGAKFLTCESCKARVALPSGPGGSGAATIPKIPPRPPAIPAQKRSELADLPAPKRQGPLAGIDGGKPAPKAGLDFADLPAPKAARPAAAPDFDVADLPAPKGAKSSAASDFDLSWGSDASADLPAPKLKPGPPPVSSAATEVLDLPAPRPAAKAGKPPVASAATVPLDLPRKPPPFRPDPNLEADLPAPKSKAPAASFAPTIPAVASGASLDIIDLPAPKLSGAISDLPAPKNSAAQRVPGPPGPASGLPDIIDLPTPKGISDLPAPKGVSDLPAPKGVSDLLTPKPGANFDLPAPKGFFDDLPQPAAAAKQPSSDLIAPKGFFDDLPQPAKAPPALPGSAGFFGDLPPPNKPAMPPPAPGNFFDDDDLGLTSNAPRSAPSGVFDDLPDPSAKPAPFDMDLSLGEESVPNSDPGAGASIRSSEPALGADLDLGLPSAASDFGDLDLSAPSPAAKPAITIKSNSVATPPKPTETLLEAPKPGAELRFELEDESTRVAQIPSISDREVRRPATVGAVPAVEAKKPKRKALLLGGAAAVVVAALGGGFFYRRHAVKQQRAAAVAEHLKAAQAAIYSDQAEHWTRAANEARAVLEVDERNVVAIGLRAEALIAGALDTGVSGETRIAEGRRVLSQALEKNLNGPGLETAQALAFVAGNQADRSLAKLDEAVKREPKNGFLHLYKGWALTATNDPKGAAQSFDAALTADPNAKLPALYGRGRAKLLLLDLEAARADFSAILAIAKDHIGAQVGLAVAQSVSQQREADLLAVLARKDIAAGDPRAVVFAWTQAGDIARDSDRLDVARERYRQALTLSKQDIPALIGLARVELREGKVAQAAELVQKALGQRADDLEAMLTAAEVSLRQGKVEEALAMTSKLSARVPPVLPLQRARLQLVIGNVLESQSKDDEAIAAWMEGAKAAGDLDLAPMMAAVKKLGALAKKATDSHDESKAADYRARADELLSSLADRAHNDPQLSKALGAAYFGAGDFSKAEQLLRRAVEIRDSDIDARLALARVLVSLRRLDDALQQLHAAQALDASRLDVSLELARTLDGARRDADATAEYTKLIAQKEAPIQARIHAGRFLARKGDFKRASEQAEAILKAEPDNAAGHYLKGEGLIAANKLDDARRELTLAVETDPDPQYLDAQGRAAEASQIATGDTKYYDLALRAYERAIDADATMFNPQAGTGRVYVARREWSKAAAPLAAAIKIDPKSTEVMYNLGVTYKSLGHIPEAIEWLESVVRSKPDPDAYWQLAQLYQDNNRGRDTANALQQATRLARDKETSQGVKVEWLTEAWYRLGEIQLGLHNDAAAKAAYEMYVGRNPTPGAQLSEARRLLSTTLR